MTNEHAAGAPAPQTARARRFADRLADLGLTEAQAATRAGMSIAYLRRVLELDSDFDPPALLRLAAVLGLDYQELVSGRPAERVHGASAAPRSDSLPMVGPPVLGELGTADCWDRLGASGLGRLARTGPDGPVVRPVSYLVHDRTVLYRTNPDGVLAPAAGGEAAFEVDHADPDLRQGWSVLMVGPLAYVTEPALLAELPQPSAHGRWVRLTPATVTGRTISTASAT
ncbi:pyridoxamine 5'-phosphate oxidase family protein [Kitasatospora sp. CB02891]|uniref:pyridoxamine 5'-phosphate oxidase family protein n=1 Tax=Kitasatospora sp. CB02891 TaxID=2020329 RepID=UPI000C27A47D|nr:pyridoxamine 5'-phosphate oxidase family protein [Kitasatospora sp. CB02891]PJN28037.1 XRE family transcriptional regulator [Kitasatospora sp. CB02891]